MKNKTTSKYSSAKGKPVRRIAIASTTKTKSPASPIAKRTKKMPAADSNNKTQLMRIAELEKKLAVAHKQIKRNSHALRESELRLRSVIDNAPIVLFAVDLQGIFTLSIGRGLDFLGLKPGQVIGMSAFEVYKRVPQLNANLRRALNGETVRFESIIGTVAFEAVYTPLYDRQKNLVGATGIGFDITDRKHAEAALREAELRYRTLFQQASESIVIIDPETTTIVEFNDTACRRLGYSREEFTNRRIFDIEAAETPEETQICTQKLLREGKITFETLHRTKQDEIRNVIVTAQLIELGGKTFIQSVFHDITEHKQAESLLKYERNFAKRLIDAAPVIILLLDTQGIILHVNPFFERLTGYRLDEIKGKEWFSTFLPTRDQDRIRLLFQTAVRDIPTRNNVNPIVTRNGEECEIEWNDQVIYDTDGKVTSVLAVGLDITEHNKLQRELLMKDLAIETSINSIGITDMSGILTYVNASTVKMWGYDSATELIGRHAAEFWQEPQDMLQVIDVLGNEGKWQGELRAKKKDGLLFFYYLSAHLVKDQYGVPQGMMASGIDVTERKRMEQALQRSQEQAMAQYKSIPIPTYTYQRQGDDFVLIDYNTAAETHTRGGIVNFAGKTLKETIPNRPDLIANISRCFNEKTTFSQEVTYRLQSTSEMIHMVSTYVFVPPDLVMIHTEDITKRKVAEEALAEREKRYSALFNLSPSGILLEDIEGNIVDVNETFCKSLGYTREELVGKNVRMIASLKEISAVENHIALLRSGKNLEHVVQNVRKDGTMCWMELRETLVPLANGQQGFLTIAHDITERKQAEDDLLQTSAKLEATLKAIPDLLFEVDQSGRIVDYSAYRDELLAVPPKQLLGKAFADVLPSDVADICRETIQIAAEKGTGLSKPYKLTTVAGEHWYELSVARKGSADNEEAGFILLARDITERVRAEQTLRDSEERFRSIVEATPSALVIVEKSGNIFLVNERTEQLFGYTREELVGKPLDILLPERFRTNHVTHMSNYFESPVARQMCPGSELFGLRKNGTEVPVEIALMPMKIGDAILALSSITDVTLRKNAERVIHDSEITLNRAQAVAHMGSWRLDVQQNVLDWSHETYKLFGVPDGVSLTYDSFLSYIHPDDREYVDASWKAALQGAPYDIEHRIVVNGEIKWVRERAELEMDAGGALQHGIGTVQDITERKLAEETIRASLKEKELLLKEIHHRVKNNLQIVSSLLYLQSTKTEDEATRATLLEGLNRIKSMALLHEELYRSGDLQRINFGEYLQGFLSTLKESYMKPASPINIEIIHNGDKIDFDKAIYCGLIINELVSNALKYAFPGNMNGKIEIGLLKKEEQFILTVSDNGIGMKDINELSLKKSMGLLIVERLVYQLNGTMEHQTVGGTTFIIKFEEKEP
jgi:PAS domain S-box-containing protein